MTKFQTTCYKIKITIKGFFRSFRYKTRSSLDALRDALRANSFRLKKLEEDDTVSPSWKDEIMVYQYNINDATTGFRDIIFVYHEIPNRNLQGIDVHEMAVQIVNYQIGRSPEFAKQLEYYKDVIVKDLAEWIYNNSRSRRNENDQNSCARCVHR